MESLPSLPCFSLLHQRKYLNSAIAPICHKNFPFFVDPHDRFHSRQQYRWPPPVIRCDARGGVRYDTYSRKIILKCYHK